MIKESTLEEAFKVYSALPEFAEKSSLGEIASRIGERYLCLVYIDGSEPVGFKLGYATSSTVFYSWLGGVLPNHRKRGIAQQLLRTQEQWVKAQGFSRLEVKSKNRFPAMLTLLIGQGYWISAVTEASDPLETKIHFFKSIMSTST